MHTPDSFPHLLDKIFEDLKIVSKIEITCKIAGATNDEQKQVLSILSVNSQKSERKYNNYLKFLKSVVLEDLKKTLHNIASENTEIFIEQAEDRISQIAGSVTNAKVKLKNGSFMHTTHWSAKVVTILCNEPNTLSPDQTTQAIIQTQGYTLIFDSTVKKIFERLSSYAGISAYHSFSSEPEPQSTPENTIYKISGTLEFTGAMIRVFCDRQLLETQNLSALCRQLSPYISTIRKEKPSPGNLRNCINNPKPEVLEKLLQEFKLCVKYTEKFIDRQRS